jgi:hypothetical protein
VRKEESYDSGNDRKKIERNGIGWEEEQNRQLERQDVREREREGKTFTRP